MVMSQVPSYFRRALFAASALWGAAAMEEPGVQARERQARRLMLVAPRLGKVPLVRVAPRVIMLWLFDVGMPRRAVSLEGRGRFLRVEVVERALVLQLAVSMASGDRLLHVGSGALGSQASTRESRTARVSIPTKSGVAPSP